MYPVKNVKHTTIITGIRFFICIPLSLVTIIINIKLQNIDIQLYIASSFKVPYIILPKNFKGVRLKFVPPLLITLHLS